MQYISVADWTNVEVPLAADTQVQLDGLFLLFFCYHSFPFLLLGIPPGLIYLVGGLEHEFYDFPYTGNVIIPTDFHIFQRGGSTTNQIWSESPLWPSSH